MLILFCIFSTAYSQICRGLILSGGGSHGAFEAGVLSGLVYNLPIEDVSYNVVVGISVGSINGLGMAVFPKGQEMDAAKHLTKTWRSLDNKYSIINSWPGGLLAGLFRHSGLYDTSAERATLVTLVSGYELQRNISLGTTNVNTGAYHVFNESLGTEGIVSAVMCSSAIPFFFPMQHFQDQYWMDGFISYHMDVVTGIQRCLDVTDESNISVDMVSCSATILELDPKEKLNSRQVMKRADDIRKHNKLYEHLHWAMQTYKLVDFRYYIRPSEPLPGELGLTFDEPSLEKSIKLGYQNAQDAINSGISAKEHIRAMRKIQTVFP